ncbi:hypothetical protein TL16_g00677 [Triparma laevis f. inornata]|uniref:Mediator of RNA polymerase II transcription subunit 31 n=2 Tax=Triparma laevis TaxID=1534972 RepID=A0A9W7EEW9_9STRA|nr:hypothetical protein TL16_g00677 [Triparma laevis f. inornata]GMH76263.1 hypothetical protein TrLO_g706 [Triparma laevis f. longispina]
MSSSTSFTSQPPPPASPSLHSSIPYSLNDVFLLDLELLQSLSQPSYLRHLSLTPPFPLQSLSFQLYLLYLYKTYSKPQYRIHIIYPLSFSYLKLLIHPSVLSISNGTSLVPEDGETKDYSTKFSNMIASESFRDEVHAEQFAAWKWRVENVYGKGEVRDGEREDGMMI